MTLLVTSIAPDSLEELKWRAEQAWAGGTQAVEVRIDTFSGGPEELAAYLRAHNDHTWIVTCRSADEGGHFRGDTMERVSLLMKAARGTDAYVDFELADWRRSSNIRQKVGLASAKTDASGHRLILSAHDFSGVPPNLAELAHEMCNASGAAGGKIAYRAGRICDSFDALDLMHRHGAMLSAVAMGEDGLWTRVLAKKLGGFATYCSLDAASATAPGQITLDEMIHRYRWSEIDSSTRVFGVIGDPVAHSMGPLLFNRWFADAGINAVYLPLHLTGKGDCLQRFLDGCRDRPWLDIGGLSVTIPHKMAALDWLGDRADHMARGIGALNTVSFCAGETGGFNTDCYAGVSSVAGALGVTRGDLVGVSVDLLGTGGAARALLYGLSMCGCKVTVYGRSRDKTHRLGDHFGARPAAWENRTHRTGEVLVNCTNVGMWPDLDVSPMPADSLEGCRLVFDLIYNPLETRLLKDAAAAGTKTLSGLDMFVRQAAMQFMLWTSISPDTRYAPDLITREIERRTGTQS
ncbi:MAG: type I 3-dehydroquinate dehydratase [Phycisphaerales bacterium]|nr:MAG: type I 3-dehydroquinate dehydratase [Phycisphaerales bacterium]